MRILLLLLLICQYNAGWSQSLEEAEQYFNKYEYVKAAEIYELNAARKALSIEDYKRLAYSYFVSGQYEKCLPLSDSIIQGANVEPMFFYMNGEVNMGNRNYEKAKSSFVAYSKMDNEYPVEVQIASCDAIPTWEQEIYLDNYLFNNNTTKADISGPNYDDALIVYREVGKDSLGDQLGMDEIDNSELVLAAPFIYSSEGISSRINIEDSLQDLSVSSICLDPKNDNVWLTISQPLADDGIDMAHHIFTGKYDNVSSTISDLSPWMYSGYEDTTACAQVTINASGDLMVFTKIGDKTKGADLYYSERSSEEWSTPKPLRALNTEMDDMYPLFIGDSILSFSSNGRPGYGHLDVFLVEVSGNTFGDVRHLKSPVNSFMDDFNFHYYASTDSARYTSNRNSGIGDDDIYFVKFSIPVIEVEADSSDFYDFVDSWEIPSIYFEFDKFDLTDDFRKLDELVAFLKEYPKSTIVLEGHADSRGTVDYNYNLGYKRSKEVKSELIEAGIRGGQISVKSKGASDPQVECKPCSEEMHAKNRVVLIKLNAK